MHPVDFLQRILTADIRDIKLTGLKGRKGCLLIKIHKGDLCKIRLLTIVVFVRDNDRLLIYITLKHFPRAGADTGGGIILIVFILGNDADKTQLVDKGGLGLSKGEAHGMIVKSLCHIEIAYINIGSGILHLVKGKCHILRSKIGSVGEFCILTDMKRIDKLVVTDLMFTDGQIILKD